MARVFRDLWVGGILLLITVPAVNYRYQRMSLRKAYQAAAATLPSELAAAKQEGIPLTPADLKRKPAISDSQNAALLYREITKDSAPLNAESNSGIAPTQDATDSHDHQLRHLLALTTKQRQLAERAANLPYCDFQRDWSLGSDLLYPEYPVLKRITRLFAEQALLQSKEGHPEAALHSIWVSARIARHISQQPTITALSRSIEMDQTLDYSFRQIISRYADRPDIVRLAIQTERAFGDAPDLKYTLGADVVLDRFTIRDIRDGHMDMSCTPLPPMAPSRQFVADACEAHNISFWRRTFAALDRSHGDPKSTYLALQAVDDTEKTITHTPDEESKPTYEMNQMLDMSFSSTARRIIIHETRRRLRKTMLALLLYRQKRGNFPDTLASISLPERIDPFTGQPMHYSQTGKGFVLYSVSIDQKDNGGDDGPTRNPEGPPDIGVSFL